MVDPRCLMDNEGKGIPFRMILRLFSEESVLYYSIEEEEELKDWMIH